MILPKKNLHRIAGSAVLAVLLYFSIGAEQSLYRLWKLKQKNTYLHQEISRNRALQDSLASDIYLLESDPTYAEKIAREKYRMGYPGEIIYLVGSQTQK